MAGSKNTKPFFNTTIPIDWDSYVLNEISEKIMVGIASAATHAYRETGIILFRNQNIKDGYLDDSDILFIDEEYEKAHRNKRLKGGDILIARTGYPGTACLVPEKFSGAQSFTTLIARPNHNIVNKEYLCLYINSEYGQGYFETNQIGGGQKNVNAGTLEFMPIPLPPLPEQRAIAHILGLMDNAINANNQLIAQKELRKKWLMQNLLTGKKRLKGFGGEWKEMTLGDIGKIKMCRRVFNHETKSEGDIPFYKIGTFGKIADAFIPRELYNDYKTRFSFPNKGDILISAAGTLGRTVVYDGSPAYFQDSNIVWISHDESKALNEYLFYVYKIIRYDSEGGTIQRLYNSIISSATVHLPSLDEQTAIAQVLQAADKEIQLLKTKTEKLRLQKKGMMQVLLTGKKRLKI